VLAAHLDTVEYAPAEETWIERGYMHGLGGGLGADDKVGVALILSLPPLQGVTLALFLGEEQGTVGAQEAARAGIFGGVRAMISLDRSGTCDIIYRQMGYDTASLGFVTKLAKELGNAVDGRIELTPSPHGIYTDSAVFADQISECTNLAVGYYGAHTDYDYVDLLYAANLLEALSLTDWQQVAGWASRVPCALDDDEDDYMEDWWRCGY